MPRKYELTWVQHARKWRKRHCGKDWYLPSNAVCNGKRDIDGYRAAMAEWQRIKDWLDGLEPCPYVGGETGRRRVLIPAERMCDDFGFARPAQVHTLAKMGTTVAVMERVTAEPTPVTRPDDLPDFCLGVGFAAVEDGGLQPFKSLPTETRISALVDEYLDRRKKEVNAGELTLVMWGEDSRNLTIFRDFITGHYLNCVHVGQITPAVLSHYKHYAQANTTSGRTLKKRLATVAKWINWLADEDFLASLPKDLSRYAKVKSLGGGTKEFFSVEQVKAVYQAADERMKLWILLALNCGATQREISTLTADMIDWGSGMLERPRNKTGELTKAKLWPVTLSKLREQRSVSGTPLLVTEKGQSLVIDWENDGKVSRSDTIGKAFNVLRAELSLPPFKAFRKTGADFVEERRPELTSIYLSHAVAGTKSFYVRQHFEQLFELTDEMRGYFGFPSV